MNSSEIGEDDASLQTAAAKGKSVNLGFRLCPIDAEQVLDCLRKKNVDDQPLPPNNIIEFNLGGYDVEILKVKGTFIFYISGHELIFQKYGFKIKINCVSLFIMVVNTTLR